MKVKTLTDIEFNQLVAVSKSTADPEFLEFYDMLLKERRLLVDKLTNSQRNYIHHAHPGKAHIYKSGNYLVVFLDP